MRLNKLIPILLSLLALVGVSAGSAQQLQEIRLIQSSLGPPQVELREVIAPPLPEAPETEAREQLKSEFAAGRYEEAVATAQVLLTQAQTDFGTDSADTITALIDLGASQHYAELYTAAEQTYAKAVELLGAERNSRDPRLAQPLHGLAMSQFVQGEYIAAVDNLERAVFVTRVNDGLNSLDQLKYYDALTEGKLALGFYEEAIARQKARIAVIRRATGAGSPETVAAVERAAQLYRRMHRYFEERDIRRRQLRTVEKNKGYDDISLVPILRELAATYRLSYEVDLISVGEFGQVILPIADRTPVGDLERALDILDKHPEIPSLDERVSVLIELGDFHLTFNETGRANRYYKLAYDLLEKAGAKAQIQALFSEPVAVFLPRPESAPGVGDNPAAGLPKGYALLKFNLDITGRPRNVETVELKPESAGIMRQRAERSMRAAKFRAVFGPNGPVKGTGLFYKLKFNYVPTEG